MERGKGRAAPAARLCGAPAARLCWAVAARLCGAVAARLCGAVAARLCGAVAARHPLHYVRDCAPLAPLPGWPGGGCPACAAGSLRARAAGPGRASRRAPAPAQCGARRCTPARQNGARRPQPRADRRRRESAQLLPAAAERGIGGLPPRTPPPRSPAPLRQLSAYILRPPISGPRPKEGYRVFCSPVPPVCCAFSRKARVHPLQPRRVGSGSRSGSS